jgi:hypothetical protein
VGVYYFVVGSQHPGKAKIAKGRGVHSLKLNVSWVKNVARQFGRIFVRCQGSDRKLRGVRKEILGDASGVVLSKGTYRSYAFVNKN